MPRPQMALQCTWAQYAFYCWWRSMAPLQGEVKASQSHFLSSRQLLPCSTPLFSELPYPSIFQVQNSHGRFFPQPPASRIWKCFWCWVNVCWGATVWIWKKQYLFWVRSEWDFWFRISSETSRRCPEGRRHCPPANPDSSGSSPHTSRSFTPFPALF